MKKILIFSFVLACISISFVGNAFKSSVTMVNPIVYKRTLSDGTYSLYEKGQVIIKLKQNTALKSSTQFGLSGIDNALAETKVTNVSKRFPVNNLTKFMRGIDDMQKIYTVKFSSDMDPYEVAGRIFAQNEDILEYACVNAVMEPDFIPNDPTVGSQYHIQKISSYGAWDITQGDTTVCVGIIDSGSDLDHPDLGANIKYNYADIPNNGIDDDNNGYIDDFMGWDFGDGDSDPNCNNDHNSNAQNCSHGSHVSGCVTEVTNNGVGGAGIGYKVKLVVSKHGRDLDFSAPGGTSYIYSSDAGFYYCAARGVKVINCSFGSASPSAVQNNAVQFAWTNGAVICASAGNDGLNILRFPAAYDHVVCVASSNSADLKSSFSNYHDTVDVIAPGENIYSTLWNNGYNTLSGTSMSSPITAGTVALIRSKYPAWDNSQVVARLKLGVDSIYSLNPTYAGQLGTGRINAFKCVADFPIITLQSNASSDSLYGNNDKTYDVNEVVTISLNYKNIWLAGNNVSLRLSTTDPNVTIVQDSVYAGNLAAYTSYSTTVNNTFRVKANPTCPYDRVVTFTLKSSNNAYIDPGTNTISVTFRQGWANHTVNNMKLSLTKDGAVGKKPQPYGNGLFVTGYTGNELLDGGLMIGVSNTKVSDDVRRGVAPTTFADSDFTAFNGYAINKPGAFSDEDGKGYFNDDGAGSSKIGVTVRAESFAWGTAPDANYIILRYTIKNTSGAAISNMFAGVYAYYTPNGTNTNNISTLDTAGKLGYTYNTGTTNPYLGVSLLSNQNMNFRAINATDIFNGFTAQEKWDALSSGISIGSQGPGINCFVISAGPLNLNNNDSVTVGFAVVKGNDLNDLKTNSNTARLKFGVIGIEQISAEVPAKFSLSQNYPNPFNPATTIKFNVAKSDFITIRMYDILGREVQTLVNRQMQPGSYKVDFDASALSSGVYFYRIESKYFTDVKKMMLIK